MTGVQTCALPIFEPVLIDESLANVTQKHLLEAIMDISDRIKYRKPVSAKAFSGLVGREIVSVFSKVKAVLLSLKSFRKMKFSDVFKGVKTRSEAVASFLAVLELVKMNRVNITNQNGEIEIKYVNKKKGEFESFGNSED